MSVAQLSYFVAVAEEQHLTRAALRLHISQPPLTRQIRSLEEELGAPLFERGAKGMKLLPKGEVFLREAREILARIHALPALVSGAEDVSGAGDLFESRDLVAPTLPGSDGHI